MLFSSQIEYYFIICCSPTQFALQIARQHLLAFNYQKLPDQTFFGTAQLQYARLTLRSAKIRLCKALNIKSLYYLSILIKVKEDKLIRLQFSIHNLLDIQENLFLFHNNNFATTRGLSPQQQQPFLSISPRGVMGGSLHITGNDGTGSVEISRTA